MANKWAVQDGNWSSTSTWNSSTLPGTTDDVYADGYTVTIDQNVEVQSIQNSQRSGGTVGGRFILLDNCDVIANITNANTGVTTFACLTYSGTISASIVGNINGFGGTNIQKVEHNGSGTLYVVGNVTAGGNSTSRVAILNSSNGTVDVTGDVYGSSASGSVSDGINNTSVGTIRVTGTVNGGTGTNQTIVGVNNNVGLVEVIGTVNAQVGNGIDSITGTVIVTGIVNASNNAHGIQTTNTNGVIIVDGEIVSGSTGLVGVYAPRVLVSPTSETIHTYRTYDSGVSDARSLYTANALSDYPSESDVRSGVQYAEDNLTGTMIVPPTTSVASGVPVDDTVGTAMITPESLREALGLTSANLEEKIDNIPGEVLSASSSDVEDTAATDSLCAYLRRMDHSNTVDNPGFLTVYKSDGEVFDLVPIQASESLPITGVGETE